MSEHRANVRFDHTIIPARDKRLSAEFFTRVFGLDDPAEAGFFLQVRLSDGRLLDFAEPGVDFPGHHYAFLVDDETFDAIVERIRRDGVVHWADPQQRLPGQINTNHGGRGVYFDDPAGHHLEAITARYDGSALTLEAGCPHCCPRGQPCRQERSCCSASKSLRAASMLSMFA